MVALATLPEKGLELLSQSWTLMLSVSPAIKVESALVAKLSQASHVLPSLVSAEASPGIIPIIKTIITSTLSTACVRLFFPTYYFPFPTSYH